MKPSRAVLIAGVFPLALLPALAAGQPVNLFVSPATRSSAVPPAGAAGPAQPAQLAPTIFGSGAPQRYLDQARAALASGRYADANDALEKAETRLLNLRSGTPPVPVSGTDQAIRDIRRARQALARRDRRGVTEAIGDAEAALAVAYASATVSASRPVPPARPSAPPAVPQVTYALLPGHWTLAGATSVWVPPETTLRRVESRPFVEGRYVWRGGKWVWVPPHNAGSGGSLEGGKP